MQFLKHLFFRTDVIYVQQKEGHMKNSWVIWFMVVGVVITILVAFNYQDEQASIPLSEIFPETEESYPVNIEYEFVDDKIERTSSPQTAKVQAAEEAVSAAAAAVEKKETVVAAAPIEEVAEKAAVKAPISIDADAQYSIQVASFKTKDRADQKVAELAKKNLEAFVISRDLKDKGVWYRVYIGQYASRDEADSSLASVKEVVSDGFVISIK